MRARLTRRARWCAWTNAPSNSPAKCARPWPPHPGNPHARITSMNATGWRRSFAPSRRTSAGGASRMRERKTRVDCAHFLRAVCDVDFTGAEKLVLVQDNLNTHSPASLYEAFPPAEAARIRARFEFASLRSRCGLPAAGYLAALGSLHAQARELAGHRRDRTQCADARLPRPTHPGPHRTSPRTRRVGTRSQSEHSFHPLAVHHRHRSHQTPQALPII